MKIQVLSLFLRFHFGRMPAVSNTPDIRAFYSAFSFVNFYAGIRAVRNRTNGI